jgi:hypothetical protein
LQLVGTPEDSWAECEVHARTSYADEKDYHDEWLPSDRPMFNREELWSFEDFWNYERAARMGED